MKITQDIIKEEERLLNFVLSEISDKMQKYCQLYTSDHFLSVVAEEEEMIIEKWEIELEKELQIKTPLHFSVNRYSPYNSPLINVKNNCRCYRAYFIDFKKDYLKKYIFPLIVSKDFEDNGFKDSFAKRVLEKYLNSGDLRRKREMGGYIYFCSNEHFTKIKDLISFSCEFLDSNQRGIVKEQSFDWILEKFDKKIIKEVFNTYKNKIFDDFVF
jgi:hypothetical protein